MAVMPPGVNSAQAPGPFSNGTMNTIGGVLGGLDLFGGLSNFFGGQAAANQATQGQNQLIQQIIPIINQLQQSQMLNQQPLINALGGSSGLYSQLLNGLNPGAISGAVNTTTGGPNANANYTGVNLLQLLGPVLAQLMNPQGSYTGQVAPGIINSLGNPGTNLQQLYPGTTGTLLGPNAVSSATPGAMSALMNPKNFLSGQSGVGGEALAYDLNQASTGGIDPRLVNQAMQGIDQQAGRQISEISDNPNIPNPSGLINDISENALQASAGAEENLTGQSQQLRNQAMQQAESTAQGIDQQQVTSMLQAMGLGDTATQLQDQQIAQATGTANTLDMQSINRMMDVLSSSGSVDQLLNSMMTSGFGLASGYSSSNINELLQGAGLEQGTISTDLNSLLSYFTEGQSGLNTAIGTLGQLANEYGQSASQASSNASSGLGGLLGGLGSLVGLFA